MAIISNNGIITLNRGDSFSSPLFINANDEFEPIRYTLRNDDKIYFGVMEGNSPFECSLIRKVFTKDDLNNKGDVIIKLIPNDTQYLQPGSYYYEIKLVIKKGLKETVETVVPRKKFIIVE